MASHEEITQALAHHGRGPVRTVDQYRYDAGGSTSKMSLKLRLGSKGSLDGDDAVEMDLNPTGQSHNGLAMRIPLPPQMPADIAVLMGALAKRITSLVDDRAALAKGREVVHELQLVDGKWRLPSKKKIEFTVSELERSAKKRRVYEIARDGEVAGKTVRIMTIYARGKIGKKDDLFDSPKEFEYFDVVRKVIYDWHDNHWRVSAAKGTVVRVDSEGTKIDDSDKQLANLHGDYFKNWATHTIENADLPFPPELRIVEERNEEWKVDWTIEDRDFRIICKEGTTYCEKDDLNFYMSIENGDLGGLNHDKWNCMPYTLHLTEEEKEEDGGGGNSSSSDSEAEEGVCDKEGCKEKKFYEGLCMKHYRKMDKKRKADAEKSSPNKKSKRSRKKGK